jgi:hypothetical protein
VVFGKKIPPVPRLRLGGFTLKTSVSNFSMISVSIFISLLIDNLLMFTNQMIVMSETITIPVILSRTECMKLINLQIFYRYILICIIIQQIISENPVFF